MNRSPSAEPSLVTCDSDVIGWVVENLIQMKRSLPGGPGTPSPVNSEKL